MMFKSKIAWWFYALEVLLAGVTVAMVVLAATAREWLLVVVAAGFVSLMGFVMLPMLLNTRYVLEETQLRVVCGFSTWRVPYKNILGVKPNFDPSSSPALSLDRVQVRYSNKDGGNNFLSLSPKEKDKFIEALNARVG